jgi:hypothetical protein
MDGRESQSRNDNQKAEAKKPMTLLGHETVSHVRFEPEFVAPAGS